MNYLANNFVRTCLCILVICGADALVQGPAAFPVTIETLLHEMIDRDTVARFPSVIH